MLIKLAEAPPRALEEVAAHEVPESLSFMSITAVTSKPGMVEGTLQVLTYPLHKLRKAET